MRAASTVFPCVSSLSQDLLLTPCHGHSSWDDRIKVWGLTQVIHILSDYHGEVWHVKRPLTRACDADVQSRKGNHDPDTAATQAGGSGWWAQYLDVAPWARCSCQPPVAGEQGHLQRLS